MPCGKLALGLCESSQDRKTKTLDTIRYHSTFYPLFPECISICLHYMILVPISLFVAIILSTSSISQCRPQYSRWNDANKIWCWTVSQTRKVVIYWKCWLHGWEVKEKSNGRQCELARTFCWVDGIWWQTPAMCHCQIECESSFHLQGELKEGWNRGLGLLVSLIIKEWQRGNELRHDG